MSGNAITIAGSDDHNRPGVNGRSETPAQPATSPSSVRRRGRGLVGVGSLLYHAAMRRSPVAWAFYDWANSAWTTTVLTAFFPALFVGYWSKGTPAADAAAHLGIGNSIAGLVLAVSAPFLGALADAGLGKKRMLATFAGMSIVATAALWFVDEGAWLPALVLYGIAYIGWLAANIAYDSMLTQVSTESTVHRVSSLGFALGYLGGGILLAANLAMVVKPAWFGLSGAGEAARVSVLAATVWWAIFSLPLLLRVDEVRGERRSLGAAARMALSDLRGTIRELRKLRMAFLFLIAYWLYIDGVDTVIIMATAYGKALGYADRDLFQAILLVQLIGFPCALAYGWLSSRIRARTLLFVAIGVYVVLTVLASRMTTEPYNIFGMQVSQFYVLALLVATSQGGIQALSRSLYAQMIPAGHEARFFGFYNMVGKFGAFLGPALMGIIGKTTGDPRIGIFAISVFFILGGVLLARVDVARGIDDAKRYAQGLG